MLRLMTMTSSMLLKRTPMMRICTAPFYAEVVWRGWPGAELCGVFFNPSSLWERTEIGLTATDSDAGGWEDIESGTIDQATWVVRRSGACSNARSEGHLRSKCANAVLGAARGPLVFLGQRAQEGCPAA